MPETNTNDLCSNCGHPVFYDEGVCYHVMRVKGGSCHFQGKTGTCGCKDAFGDKRAMPAEPRVSPVKSVVQPTIALEEDTGPRPAHPVKYVLTYLLIEKEFALSDALLVLELCKRQIIDNIVKDNK